MGRLFSSKDCKTKKKKKDSESKTWRERGALNGGHSQSSAGFLQAVVPIPQVTVVRVQTPEALLLYLKDFVIYLFLNRETVRKRTGGTDPEHSASTDFLLPLPEVFFPLCYHLAKIKTF